MLPRAQASPTRCAVEAEARDLREEGRSAERIVLSVAGSVVARTTASGGGAPLAFRLAAVALAVALAAAAWPSTGLCRAGGGQAYHKGGGSSDTHSSDSHSSYHSSGGGGGESGSSSSRGGGRSSGGASTADKVFLLVLVVVCSAGAYLQIWWNDRELMRFVRLREQRTRGRHQRKGGRPPGAREPAAGHVEAAREESEPSGLAPLALLHGQDPNFSRVLLLDFARLLYTKYQRARGTGDDALAPLAPFLAPDLAARLAAGRKAKDAPREVKDVIIGAAVLESAEARGDWITVTVDVQANLTEERAAPHGSQPSFVEESLVLSRRRGVRTPGPAAMRALHCPACGSPLALGADGACASCGRAPVPGEGQWMLAEVHRRHHESLAGFDEGALETREETPALPLERAPGLDGALSELKARDPAFSREGLEAKVRASFLEIQRAWSELDWERTRPLQTEALYQSNLFWIERYRRRGLRNRLEGPEVLAVEPADAQRDAFYDTVTVRVTARGRDSTVDAHGKVLAGNPGRATEFREYWTFIRRVAGGAIDAVGGLAERRCPDCDGVVAEAMTQECPYCKSLLASSEFDWTLAFIDQEEASGCPADQGPGTAPGELPSPEVAARVRRAAWLGLLGVSGCAAAWYGLLCYDDCAVRSATSAAELVDSVQRELATTLGDTPPPDAMTLELLHLELRGVVESHGGRVALGLGEGDLRRFAAGTACRAAALMAALSLAAEKPDRAQSEVVAYDDLEARLGRDDYPNGTHALVGEAQQLILQVKQPGADPKALFAAYRLALARAIGGLDVRASHAR